MTRFVRGIMFNPHEVVRGNTVFGTDQRSEFFREVGDARARIVRQLGTDDDDAPVFEPGDTQSAFALAVAETDIMVNGLDRVHEAPSPPRVFCASRSFSAVTARRLRIASS